MAEVLPSHWEELRLAGASAAEMATLEILATGLDERFTIVHGVHWTGGKPQRTVFGEVDFCVLGPTGKLLVIEQKNGALLEKDGGLFKAYSTKEKNVGSQIHRSLDGIRTKFQRAHPGTPLILDYLLYCPEHRVQKLDAVGLDRDHIVDATRFRDLPRIVAQLADADAPRDDIRRDTVRSFLLDTWQLFPDVNAFMDIASKSYSQLSGGLTTWVQRLHLSPFRLRVDGTAGSGKTQKSTPAADAQAVMVRSVRTGEARSSTRNGCPLKGA